MYLRDKPASGRGRPNKEKLSQLFHVVVEGVAWKEEETMLEIDWVSKAVIFNDGLRISFEMIREQAEKLNKMEKNGIVICPYCKNTSPK